MKGFTRLLLATLLVSGAASATKIPIPIEGATLNVSAQFQPWVLFSEKGAANASDLGIEFYLRRARLLINGDISANFVYLSSSSVIRRAPSAARRRPKGHRRAACNSAGPLG